MEDNDVRDLNEETLAETPRVRRVMDAIAMIGHFRPRITTMILLLLASPALAKQACVCGAANGNTFTSIPTSDFCVGREVPSAIIGTGPWTWDCVAPSCVPVMCQANEANTPFLTITFSPPNPQVADFAPAGTVIATVQVSWSDGSRFTGTIGFVDPYGDDMGTFALSGNDIIINPNGPGLSLDGNSVQMVSIGAAVP